MARRSGFEQVLTFDMGGTSTDVALFVGDPKPGNEAEVAGYPVRVPMLDIHTVGAGGGSLARFDAGGALRVGPESAGADPGPICYGRGMKPTVTDANLLLGRLQPDRFLGGEFTLDIVRTRAIVSEWLKSQRSRLTTEQFAQGVIRVVNANMERALRVVSIERGHDPRRFSLVAFGGAGGLHACELAQSLTMPRAIIPAIPGTLSAYGLLASDIVRDYSRTLVWSMRAKLPMARLREQFAGLEKKASHDLRAEGWSGKIRFSRSADLRYHGQGFELNVAFSPAFIKDFHQEHKMRYGYSHDDREVELVTVRLRAQVKAGHAHATGVAEQKDVTGETVRRRVFFAGRPIPALICGREWLPRGKRLRGPAIVTEYSATAVVPPGATFLVDRAGNLVIEMVPKERAPRRAPHKLQLYP